jgi:hypothetical protein
VKTEPKRLEESVETGSRDRHREVHPRFPNSWQSFRKRGGQKLQLGTLLEASVVCKGRLVEYRVFGRSCIGAVWFVRWSCRRFRHCGYVSEVK